MGIELLPYILLLIAIIIGWKFETRISMAVFVAAVIAGLVFGRLTPMVLIWIGILGFFAWLPAKLNLKEVPRILCLGIFFIFAILMSNHLAPGFNNFRVFEDTKFSPDSIPFTMYLNFDKASVGLFIYLFFIKARQSPVLNKMHLITSVKVLGALLILIIPTALSVRYLHVDLKFPEFSWVWALNNIFFVCLAEEALFRGFIQKRIFDILPKAKIWAITSIVIAAFMFGLAHYRGGVAYMALATVAGLFYGYAYHKTDRLESSILVHFGLNLVHFLFFSYPALIKYH